MRVPHGGRRHTDIRYAGDVFEALCRNCAEWQPLDLDHWSPRQGMARCKACIRAYAAAWARGKRGDAAWVEGVREVNRVMYRANREARLAATQAWREQNKPHVAAYMRAWRARKRAAA